MSIEKVAVLGGGLMGSGIAESTARAGLDVVVRDIDEAAFDAARGRIETSLGRAVERGKVDKDEAAEVLNRIAYTDRPDDVADADLVIEAVPENAELKANILGQVAGIVSEDTLIASNTSSIPIAQLAAGLARPERVLGLHFFSPVPVMSLVEIVVALDTSEATATAAQDFAARIGKRAIVTKDRSGFIVNMLLVPYLMAAVRMYEEGFATAEDIDEGMKLGCGHPMGPLTLCDMIGLDVLYSVCDSLYEEFKEPGYAPPPLMKRMVASGRIGRKAGRGFYDYGRDREAAASAR
jgi:3-hydroxybutyryl-CoA dehydrogenase